MWLAQSSTLVACWLFADVKGKTPTSLYRIKIQTEADRPQSHQVWQTSHKNRSENTLFFFATHLIFFKDSSNTQVSLSLLLRNSRSDF